MISPSSFSWAILITYSILLSNLSRSSCIFWSISFFFKDWVLGENTCFIAKLSIPSLCRLAWMIIFYLWIYFIVYKLSIMSWGDLEKYSLLILGEVWCSFRILASGDKRYWLFLFILLMCFSKNLLSDKIYSSEWLWMLLLAEFFPDLSVIKKSCIFYFIFLLTFSSFRIY